MMFQERNNTAKSLYICIYFLIFLFQFVYYRVTLKIPVKLNFTSIIIKHNSLTKPGIHFTGANCYQVFKYIQTHKARKSLGTIENHSAISKPNKF